MAKRIDVMISSTTLDLKSYREAARDAVLERGFHPIMVNEYGPAMDANAVKVCMDAVDEAEIYVGIFAHRYGFIPAGSEISITEMEYRRAIANGIPCYCFVIQPGHAWNPDYIEGEPGQSKLKAFKAELDGELVRKTFTTPDSLKAAILAALAAVQNADTPKIICNLAPQPPDSFAGRTEEISTLLDALSGKQAMAITALKGMGGMGKTTLAQKLAHEAGFGMVLWAELGETWNEALETSILNTWGRMLAGREYPPGTPPKQIAADLRMRLTEAAHNGCGEPVLLVIDNVWNDTVGLARLLREAAPAGARVLVTTRSEDVAASLDCASVPLNRLKPVEGAAMMRGLLNPGDRERAAENDLQALSETLGGHPLSLNLAARQLRRNFQPRKVGEMAARMRKGLDAGDDFAALKLDAGEARADSVAVALRQTLDTLSEDRQAQFHMLGVLPVEIPFRGTHALAIWKTDDTGALDDLVAEGLIEPVQDKDDQYTQHRLLRAYALAMLRKDTGKLAKVEPRHWNYLIALAGSVFDEREYQPETWGELDDDLPQLHALGSTLAARLAASDDPAVQDETLRAMSENGAPSADSAVLQPCSAFASAVRNYINGRYVGEEGRRWLWAGLAAARTLDHERRTGLFSNTLGSWHNHRGQPQAALIYYQQSLEVDIRLEDKRKQAATVSNLGGVYSSLGQYGRALEYYQQALPLSLEVGDKRGQAATLNNLGLVYHNLGQYDRAQEYYQQALPLRIEVGDKSGQAATLSNLGVVYDRLGQHDRALEYYQQSLPLRIEVGDKRGQAATLNGLGAVYRKLGQHDHALEYHQQSLTLFIEVGDKRGQAATLNNLGGVYDDLGQYDRALEYYQQALPLRIEVGDKGGQATTLTNLGVVYANLGQHDRALEYYQQALPLLIEVGYRYVEAVTHFNIAWSLRKLRQREQALIYMQQAHDIKASIGISTAIEDDWLAKWYKELGLQPPEA